MKGPGIDPRPWVVLGRVDEETEEDTDVLVWDEALGWLIDVTVVSGGQQGDTVQCRFGSSMQGGGTNKSSPPRTDGLVVVLFPNGDPNDEAVIIAQLSDVDNAILNEVNGATIVERNPEDGQIAAIETHIVAAPNEDLEEQWRNARITADSMTLGAPDADQPFVRGTDHADAMDDLVDSMLDVVSALAVAPVVGTNVALDPVSLAAFQVAVEQFKQAREQYLSTRINAD